MSANQIAGKQGELHIVASVQQLYYFLDRLLKLPVYYWVGLVECYRADKW